MKSEITQADDGTITLKITVPWSKVEEAREKVLDELVKQVELPGFRKGTAPKKLAAEKLPKDRVQEETMRKVLPDAYVAAVKEANLNPILNPRIHVEAFEEGTDMVFTAETSEEPKVELKNYKDEVKKITAKSKIAIPGKEEQKVNLDKVVEAVIKTTDITMSYLLIEQEANRLLSNLIDELKKLGLTLDQYLASGGKDAETLRKEYETKAQNDLKLEFVLRKIADAENITVEEKDVQDVLATIKDENQKKAISQNPYLLAAIIRQQKTLDFLGKI